MSHRYKRQSSVWQRNSLSPQCSYDGTFRRSFLDSSSLPLPDLKSMKVYKGYESVTFQPETILFPFSADQNDYAPTECDDNISVFESRLPSMDNEIIKEIGLENVSREEARQQLLEFVKNKYCYGTRAAREMSIKDSHHSFIIGYTLESVSEQRQLHWAFEPYWDTESLNHSLKEMSSPPEDPWTIEVHPFDDVSPITTGLHDPDSPVNIIPKSYQVETIEEELESQTDQSSESIVTINEKECLKNGSKNRSGCEQFQKQNQIFKDQCIEMSVPGTMTIHTCHVCAGVMRKRCTSCTATGSMKCDACNGLGYFGAHHNKSNLVRSLGTESISDYCWKCQGRGRLRCDTCTGSGMMICVGCAGSGQIKCFIKMIVTLTNHQNSAFIRDPVSFEIPVKELKSVDGRIVLDEKGCDLKPSPFFDELIGKECRQLLRLHRIKLPANSRLILQRHRIKIISVHKFHCTWAGDKFRFYLIGQTPNLKCIAINYPQRFSLSALNHCRCCTLI